MQQCLSSTFVFRIGLFFCLFQNLSGNQMSHSCVGLLVPACWLCAQLQLLSSSQTLSFFAPVLFALGTGVRTRLPRWKTKSLPRSRFHVRQTGLSAVPI